MSIVNDILEELWNTEINHKGMRVNIFGIPRFDKHSKRSIRTTVDRLKTKGLIEKEITGISISKQGIKYIKRKQDSLKSFTKNKNIREDKNLLVMFDIPTERKAEREWLRWHLKKFGYILVQQSIWVGPSPLPNDFLNYLKEIKLEKCIKTFKLSKSYDKYHK